MEELPSHAGREEENICSGLPRDSMVSVSLTDHETVTEDDPCSKHNTSETCGQTVISNVYSLPGSTDFVSEVATGAQNIDQHAVDKTGVAASSAGTIDEQELNQFRPRSDSIDSEASIMVDWAELDREEEQEPRAAGSDESTALLRAQIEQANNALLAQLEQANNALAQDPKSMLDASDRGNRRSRPPSIQQLKKLVNEPQTRNPRQSSIPSPPPMTELEFWAALVKDFPQTAQRLPILTANKLHHGVPPPLRGVVWLSMASARDQLLEEQYDKFCEAPSPYEQIIGKDIGRSFPGVEMFRDPEGDGQKMLAKVLKCFSLYDNQIGYCQGLGFLVGPLLMQMNDREAFCVLIRLMDHYDLRSCFLPDLSGLHLRIFQFQRLLSQHLPTLAAHLESLQVEATYLSQWFLSLFAATCPLPMLFRIYDVIFAEGASETLMRVALSIMGRNEKKILAFTEFEDVLQLLLSRGLWDPYNCNADDLVKDFVGLTGLVTREGLQSLEVSFKEAQAGDASSRLGILPDVQAAASKFLGRLWTPSNTSTKSASLSPGSAHSRPASFLQRTASKQSIASTLHSVAGTSERSVSTVETLITEPSGITTGDEDCLSLRSTPDSLTTQVKIRVSHQDSQLHGQIEDLLTALSELQREHAQLSAQLQKEREDREEDHRVSRPLVDLLKMKKADAPTKGHRRGATESICSFSVSLPSALSDENLHHLVDVLDQRMSVKESSRSTSYPFESSQVLRSSLARQKQQLDLELARNKELRMQLDAQGQEANLAQGQLQEARTRLQDANRAKQRLEHTVQELRAELRARTSRRGSMASPDVSSVVTRPDTGERQSGAASVTGTTSAGGLREFKLGRPGSATRTQNQQQQFQSTWGRRSSSLGVHSLVNSALPASETASQLSAVSTPMTPPLISPSGTYTHVEEPLEMVAEGEKEENARVISELVMAKTAEAEARQELEEMRAKFDALKKMLGSNSPGIPPAPALAGQVQGQKGTPGGSNPTSTGGGGANSSPTAVEVNGTKAGSGGGARGWGWGKKRVSSGVVSPPA